jgi:membrane dipeptidase
MIVDGHLDLAYGALGYGRNLENLSAHEIRTLEKQKLEAGLITPAQAERGLAMCTLSELERGKTAIVFGTLYAAPAVSWTHPGERHPDGYDTPEEAQAQGFRQLDVYEAWEKRGRIRMLKSKTDLEHHLELWNSDGVTGLVVLMEGADPIVTPDDLPKWWDRGVRIVGTSWGPTRYAGGTGTPTGLTDIGRELIAAMRTQGMILDASHQSHEAFWDSIEVGVHRVIASHSNSFSINPTSNRHITDEMIRAIGERDGRIGIVLFNRFLDQHWTRETPDYPVTLEGQVLAHLSHMANLIGWDKVCIGSDIDGGLGRDETPQGLDVHGDIVKIGDVVPPEARDGVLGQNWISFLREALPQ